MFKEIKRLLSRFQWISGKQVFIRVNKTKKQAEKITRVVLQFTTLLCLAITVVWFVLTNAGNIGTSVFSVFHQQEVIYNLFPLRFMFILTTTLFFIIIGWLFLHSRFSPIKNWRLIGFLIHATSELDLLKNHEIYQDEEPTKYIEWIFHYDTNHYLYIELLIGGHIHEKLCEDIARRLTGFLILRTHNKDEWVLTDNSIDELSGSIRLVYGLARKRFVIDDTTKIQPTKNGLIRLDSEFFFNPRKHVHLICVGRTGSAKTTLIKVCLLQIVADVRNRVYICDGKSSYLSTVGRSIPESQTATTGEELLEMLTEIVNNINIRYENMKTIDAEEDLTFLDMFPADGHIYFIFDEILALFSRIESSDKLLKPAERLLPKIQSLFTEVLQLGRASNVHVILSGQQIPATVLPTSSRESFGAKIVLGRIDPSNAVEILGIGKNALPNVDTSNYGSLVWLDGFGWDTPKFMLAPYIDESVKYKQALRELRKT